MRLFLLLAALSLLPAQEKIPARASPGDYKAHVPLSPQTTLAADFLGRTVPAPNASFVLKDYLVVEIALFTRDFTFNTGQFPLRLNGKSPVLPQTPGMVAASLKYANWENHRGIVATAGAGNAGVILGRDTTSRFPGDRRVPTPPPGSPPRAEVETGAEPWDLVSQLAWDDGPVRGPAAGLLYFPYSGNLAKLKSIELVHHGPAGDTRLTLRGSAAPPAKSAEPVRKP